MYEAPKDKHTSPPPDLYREDLDLRENILVIKEMLQNPGSSIDDIFNNIYFLKKLIGDEEITDEVATYIMEEEMLDTILCFLSQEFKAKLTENQFDNLINMILMIVNGLVSKDLDFLVKYKVLEEKYGIINFLHENLQEYENGEILNNTYMV